MKKTSHSRTKKKHGGFIPPQKKTSIPKTKSNSKSKTSKLKSSISSSHQKKKV